MVRNRKVEGEKKLNMGQSEMTITNSSIKEKDKNNSIMNEGNSKKAYNVTKRILDILLSFVGLIVLSPVFLLIGIIIKIDSKGPVFFTHKRIGKNGKEIGIYKFRTMHENAEKMIQNFTKEQMEEYKENYKLKNDPRITKIGKFLRKTSLDELPQILNILKGDLAIIGPRPVVISELEKYGPNKGKFLSVKPGLTGYWQANGRSTTTYEERIEMELYYVENRNLWLDIKIFLKTFISVLKKEGAI